MSVDKTRREERADLPLGLMMPCVLLGKASLERVSLEADGDYP